MRYVALAVFVAAIVSAALVAVLPPRVQAGEIFRDQAPQSSLNITSATVVKTVPGMLVAFSVVVAGAAGTINDTTTTGGAAASNVMASTPAVAGTYYYPMQFKNGLVVVPGAGQTVAVSYQ